ncbi:ATPase [Campylobacter sp. 9BO]|uniref:ATPase n=1 Tax=Campylobacter sp. 9BO TaxID=3424759 RepID=UPI003D32880D
MKQSELEALFSKERLNGYKDENEHRDNFLLIQSLTPKLGIIEIITRNKIAQILDISDSIFISHQTFGYWAKLINRHSIHNKLLDLSRVDFRKYAKSNRKTKLRNFYKVRICYDLLVQIRNRAFHFENLYKLNDDKPRISTLRNNEITGVMPQNLSIFLDDILECFCVELKEYLKSGEKEKLSP